MNSSAPQKNAPHTHDLKDLESKAYALSLTSDMSCAKYGDPERWAPTMMAPRPDAPAPKTKGNRTEYHCHWDPLHRYDGGRWDEVCWDNYRREAEAAFAVIQAMIEDGVIDP